MESKLYSDQWSEYQRNFLALTKIPGGKDPRIRLFKLYDKVSNLLDASWMSPELHRKYTGYTQKLLADVEKNYGHLNIVKIAHAILDTYDTKQTQTILDT